MIFDKNLLFEDDFQGGVEAQTVSTPPQQIVINNPGTVVIQSPNGSFSPSNNTFDDEANPVAINQPDPNAQMFDDESNGIKVDPAFKTFSNLDPNMSFGNLSQTDLNQPLVTPTTQDQSQMFNDELPPQDVAQTQIPTQTNQITGMPEQQAASIFDDEPQPQQNIQTPMVPNQVQVPATPNAVEPNTQMFDDEATSIQNPQVPVTTDPNMTDQPQVIPPQGIPVDPNIQPQMAQLTPPSTDSTGEITATPVNPQIAGMDAMVAGHTPEQTVDPNTGLPLDSNAAAGMGMGGAVDSSSDETNPQMTIGNSSEVTSGAPVALEDISRIQELKKINSQLNNVKSILEKELSNKYNKVEEKLNESIEYFRNIIMNLDSFSMQIDDIIFKYKRFILTILTQINTLKKQEIEEKNGKKSKKSSSKKDK